MRNAMFTSAIITETPLLVALHVCRIKILRVWVSHWRAAILSQVLKIFYHGHAHSLYFHRIVDCCADVCIYLMDSEGRVRWSARCHPVVRV